MTSRLEIAVRYAHLGMLWGASRLVPISKRSEWLEEWRSELWYVLRECSPTSSVHPRSVREATAFCMGAYGDAIWLRRRWWKKRQTLTRIRSSSLVCICFLMAMLFATWGISRTSPRVVAVNEMSRIRISPWRFPDKITPRCDCEVDAQLGNQVQKVFGFPKTYFDGLSYYNITRDAIHSDSISSTQWTVARAPNDFFSAAHFPLRPIGRARLGPTNLPRIVLSEQTWIRYFGAKQNIVGTQLRFGSVEAIVVGVASDDASNLPGGANVWLLGAKAQFAPESKEFAIGHLTPFGYFQVGPRWALSLVGMILAILMWSMMRSSVGEYTKGAHKPSLARRCRFWAFLVSKIALLFAIAYFGSVDIGCSLGQPFSQLSGMVQAAAAFILCFFGLRWAFHDQQRRCPVCLRRLSYPVEVGQLSQTFLAWNGTELVCERGHVLLHIPGMSTSWFGAQRWVCLDGSWKFLFGRPGETSSL